MNVISDKMKKLNTGLRNEFQEYFCIATFIIGIQKRDAKMRGKNREKRTKSWDEKGIITNSLLMPSHQQHTAYQQ